MSEPNPDRIRQMAAWFERLAAHNEEAAARLAEVSEEQPHNVKPERETFLRSAQAARGIASEARAVAEELEG